ncbi:hypothetical protein [Stenotrophomonas sp. BR163]|uniref:hypothetical protein n=1 Tax=Stenotrophomonas sp. BR163 TaxID=3398459 RepID=UPI0039C5E55C
MTPRNIKLPLDAIDGDIVALTDLSDSRFYRAEGRILGSKPILFRYDSGTAGWVLQSR